ncbi:hypothetical protein DMC30DRAFT_400496 [Rhodotorula diobovata]|uniref:Uncharacterized protein n=1 Tax=Rhodotorula diobovata TaxID=5288 RepID=A0A5C5FT84_9BASI|nr:hypothetical protein DMC30DRAFT_400496 [Rhodotorula diobovata]
MSERVFAGHGGSRLAHACALVRSARLELCAHAQARAGLPLRNAGARRGRRRLASASWAVFAASAGTGCGTTKSEGTSGVHFTSAVASAAACRRATARAWAEIQLANSQRSAPAKRFPPLQPGPEKVRCLQDAAISSPLLASLVRTTPTSA